MSKGKWVFNEKNDPDTLLVDPFADSKFGQNFVSSFAREIVQNSIDAKNDISSDSLVKVSFEFKNINRDKIPGIDYLIFVLEHCEKNIIQRETKTKFSKAIYELGKSEVQCLKVSDYNTTGMTLDQWNTLLLSEGVSKKRNDSSAGRHGVGKKASFLMSLCNTVFYSTKGLDNNILFGGKSMLVDWETKEGVRYSNKGWYENYQNKEECNKVNWLTNDETSEVDDFFIRKNEYGTDIIILLPQQGYDFRLDREIIKSLLENFFIGICENKMMFTVTCEDLNCCIDSNSINQAIDKYYSSSFTACSKEKLNVTYGLLNDFLKAYYETKENPIKIFLNFEDDSHLDLYLTLNPQANKKYYSFFRDHGMKIKDVNLGDSNKFYSAVVVARGQELNEFLLKLENAAHDDFIIDLNEEKPQRDKNKKLLNSIFEKIQKEIINLTRVESTDETLLEEFNDIIANPGVMNSKLINKKDKPKEKELINALVQTTTNNKTKEKWQDKVNPFKPIENEGSKSHNVTHIRPLPYPEETKDEDTKLNKFIVEKSFQFLLVVKKDYYELKYRFDIDLDKVAIKLLAKNVDNKINEVNYMVDYVQIDEEIIRNDGKSFIQIGQLDKDVDYTILVYLKYPVRYKLYIDLVGDANE